MSLSSKLWSGTGLVHCLMGLTVPELRGPLLRIIQEGTAEAANPEERYARGTAVWFHLFGGLVVLQGLAWKQYAHETNTKELPRWWGWSVTAIGITMGKIMPQSGWPLVLVQGVRIVWRNKSNHNKKIEGKEE
mmetsp:Transcript_5388/g.6221  ORF Transcript_5388/g.6221 Transcript_5388/m.6221 type:complete len:133 (-) Transcript_5388:271-669(-)|eukprot:CAMPEP_0204630450 /NCGR_PEP_ID=MMETSP0717-20131115/20477_1 /ASSEMBLY_ACC=CAM_ASM_000666 /TAXON_ID=230516 /ORGANISM="Chaetoceros curvisetus" /LENGTH=132 /DNA_ID=CAMNT_0051647695 /DNA_START=24 /DNA_END=422 /DNA_ORIENTATION=-